jgi:hypothetical protein
MKQKAETVWFIVCLGIVVLVGFGVFQAGLRWFLHTTDSMEDFDERKQKVYEQCHPYATSTYQNVPVGCYEYFDLTRPKL